MEQLMTTLKFESLDDKELTVINGVLKLIEMLALDESEQQRVVDYLYERLHNEN